MIKFTYLLIDFFTLLVPFIFSFHPRLGFYKTWVALFPGMVFSGSLFILWDSYFTSLGVWGFNARYLTGLYLGNLPLEEILFFLCIPYACVFTYFCVRAWLKPTKSPGLENLLTAVLLGISGFLAVLNHNRLYTVYTFTLLIILILIAKFLAEVDWLLDFYRIYLVLLIPFLIVNGLLTGTGLSEPVVWYNRTQIIGFRILSIPFEDVFYGFDLVLLNMLFYNRLQRVKIK